MQNIETQTWNLFFFDNNGILLLIVYTYIYFEVQNLPCEKAKNITIDDGEYMIFSFKKISFKVEFMLANLLKT